MTMLADPIPASQPIPSRMLGRFVCVHPDGRRMGIVAPDEDGAMEYAAMSYWHIPIRNVYARYVGGVALPAGHTFVVKQWVGGGR
jgi:hypothetical protein